ncbi:DUF6531 domain-containing protein, partial [Burkholderia ubonensis]|uniref:DUF6531 domain-containing protein n=1 Tax=Burkholderia ubonensis TaxID=101571 RepID=UPI0012F8F4EA
MKTPPERTKRSIGFAFGDEWIAHDDFTIDGPLPITWQRTYRSFFGANDERGNLSAFLWVRRLNKSLATRLRESLTEQDSKLVHG